MNLKNLKYLFLLMMSALVLASCSETDENTDSEYDDWQAKNKTNKQGTSYFNVCW